MTEPSPRPETQTCIETDVPTLATASRIHQKVANSASDAPIMSAVRHVRRCATRTSTTGASLKSVDERRRRRLPQTRLKTSVPLVPPKPKLFLTATSIFISRAVLAQKSRSHSGSWLKMLMVGGAI